MSAGLTDEQGAISGMALWLWQTKLAPSVGEWGEKKSVSAEALRQAAALGVSGVTGSEALDGSGLGGSKRKPSTGVTSPSSKRGRSRQGLWLVDATVFTSASHDDAEAAWSKHRRRKAVFGFKAHVGADAETALARRSQ